MKKWATALLAGVISFMAVAWIAHRSPGKTDDEQFDAIVSTMPTYQVLKEQEPQLWDAIRTRALTMQKDGKTEQQIVDEIQPQVLALQMQRLQTAPDKDVVAYMKINMEQTAAVQKVSDDDCYRFLFPEVKGGINPVRILSQELFQRRMAVDAAMMRAAVGPDKHTVTPQERAHAQQDIKPLALQLTQRYGENMEIMSNPRSGVGKEKITCNLVQDLWNSVLALPENKAAGVIRFAIASTE